MNKEEKVNYLMELLENLGIVQLTDKKEIEEDQENGEKT